MEEDEEKPKVIKRKRRRKMRKSPTQITRKRWRNTMKNNVIKYI